MGIFLLEKIFKTEILILHFYIGANNSRLLIFDSDKGACTFSWAMLVSMEIWKYWIGFGINVNMMRPQN